MVRKRRVQLAVLMLLFVSFLPIGISVPAAAAQQCTPSVTHVVQSGETLSSIAQQYGVSEASIAAANGISDPNRIYAGQRLAIPSCGGAPATSPSSGGTGQVIHVVQSGETLSSIARQYGVSEASIAAANGISDPNRIYAGQRLIIPSGGGAAVAPVYSSGAKRIEVDLSDQWMYAYEGSTLIVDSGVSTGRPGWDTPVGEFKVYAKYPLQTMRGSVDGETWEVPNVPNVMYFYLGAALHGTYWHNSFGTGARLSHGCVNLPLDVAALLYNWAPLGTPVYVRP
jgi:LysM repeat protein